MARTNVNQKTVKRLLSLILALILLFCIAIPVTAASSPMVSDDLAQLNSLISEAKAIDLLEYPAVYATQAAHSLAKAEKMATGAAAPTHEQLRISGLELRIALDTLVVDLQKATTVDLQNMVKEGKLTYKQLTQMYLDRIELYDFNTLRLNSIRVLNPTALADAEKCDEMFAADPGVAKGMFGMPTLVKDNINVMGMPTTAGSVALADNYAPYDAPLITYLKESGAVILGKTNLAEFANYFSSGMPNGWSSLGKQVGNANRPQLLFSSATGTARETFSNPSGSSSGSAVAGAAALAAVTIGSETNGSILSPSSTQSLVGIKPTRGLISRYGIVPLAETYDTAGPMTRTVTDAAVLLTAIAGYDPNDETTNGIAEAGVTGVDYTASLKLGDLAGKRIGLQGTIPSRDSNPAYHAALDALEAAGAVITNRPTSANGSGTGYTYTGSNPAESTVFYYDMAKNMPIYLATLGDDYPIKTIQDILDFTNSYAEIHGYAETYSPNVSAANRASHLRNANNVNLVTGLENYLAVRQQRWDYARGNLDRVLNDNNLDAIITNASTVSIGAVAGYPTVNMPLTQTNRGNGASISFTGAPYSEAKLIEFAYVVEQAQDTFKRTPPGLADRGLARDILTNECLPKAGGLDAAIAAARSLTTEQRAPFQDLYDSVFVIYRDNYATQMDIDETNDELRAAILAVTPADKTALNQTLEAAQEFNGLYMLGAAGENFRNLVETAAMISAYELALADEVNAAQAGLQNLLDNPAALLQATVDFADMIRDDMEHLSGDKETFLSALSNARLILGDAAATTGSILTALNDLNAALTAIDPETDILQLGLKTDAHLVTKGDDFRVAAFFEEVVSANAIVLKYSFDESKFAYKDFITCNGVDLLSSTVGNGAVTVTLMVRNYDAKNLGEAVFSAKDDVDFANEDNLIKTNLRCVVRESDGGKRQYIGQAKVSFTSAEEREYTLIDLSNLIDWFGVKAGGPEWPQARFFDFNNNGGIDVYDVSYLAQKIK